MKFSKKQNAFTLIEIIVVLIILGVLAAIAVPTYFSFVNRSRAAEAFATLKTQKDQTIACIQAHQDDLNNLSAICGFLPPSLISDIFIYDINFILSPNSVSFSAKGNGNNGITGADIILMHFDYNGNQLSCQGAGQFVGIC